MFRVSLVLVTVDFFVVIKYVTQILFHISMLSINVRNKHRMIYSRFLLPLLLETQRHFETM